MATINYATAADVELMNAAADRIAASLTEAGFKVSTVTAAADNTNAGIELSETTSISIGVDGASVTSFDGEGFAFTEIRGHSDIAGLIADLRSVEAL